jgi:phosphopantothenoylcysteine decarboxylase/phosphopantothenate--cysteine ligase
MGHIRHALGMNGPLKGKKIVVTAGGSREAIDPVRYISNRSSGKQGYAIAQAAVDAGATVTLITHPTGIPEPENMLVVQVETAAEMLAEVEKATREGAHGLIMAAAVADFTPVNVMDQKIKKRDGFGQVQLTPTEDILARIAVLRPTLPNLKAVIGFAAESQNLLENAREKLARKKLDLVVANDITASDAGFGVDDNRVNLLFPDGILDSLPLMSKEQVAETVVQQAIHLILKK